MNRLTETIKTKYIIRHTKKQKADFREFIISELTKDGFSANEQSANLMGIPVRNIIIGNAEAAKYLITAHYDTPNTSLFPIVMFADSFILSLMSQMTVLIPIFILSAAAGLINAALSLLVLYGGMILSMFTFTNKNNFNDNTSGVLSVLEILYSMDEENRKNCAFILFDNEEKGLIGSSYFYKTTINKKAEVFNIDCVGDGDEIRLFCKGTLKKAGKQIESFCESGRIKSTERSLENALYMSDDNSFPNAICFAAFRSSRFGKYISRIHTNRDTILKDENVKEVSFAIRNYIASKNRP
ncbi:MAG: M28 family peptidase [Eubacteriaceae bacterium]|nr:M28 family peptidase [Eubacteriaceae bacterium]